MLRKTLVLAALTGFVGHASLNPAFSQGLPPDDFGFEIETAEEPKQESFMENISQYFGATAGANAGASNAVDKTISAISVQLDLPEFVGLKTAASFDVGNYENVYKLELGETQRQQLSNCQSRFADPSEISNMSQQDVEALSQEDRDVFYQNNCRELIDDDGAYLLSAIERTVEDSFAELTEGYIQWEPTSFATVRFGRQPIVLGQFEVFSPLMFTTPMKATGTKTKTTKADMSYAQDGLQVSLFPLPQLEMSFTSIPKMRIDPANRKRFEEFALLKGDGDNFLPGQDQVETLADIGESDMAIARVLYYGDKFTLGLSAIQGAETNEDPIREARLVKLGCEEFFPGNNDTPPEGTDCATDVRTDLIDGFSYRLGVPGEGAFDTYALGEDKGLRFAETEAIAIEFSLRLGSKLSFIVEQTIVKSEKELGILPSGGNFGQKPRLPTFYSSVDPFSESSQDDEDDNRLLDMFEDVYQNNGAKPFINVETTMSSAGFVYKGDRWLINAQLAQRTQIGATAEEEKWRAQLDYDTYVGEDTEENSVDIIPILNAVRLLGAEKQGFAGIGFGTFGQNFGMGLSAGWRFFEKLEIGLFGGMALDVTGADEIEAEGYESPEGEGYASFGVNYLF